MKGAYQPFQRQTLLIPHTVATAHLFVVLTNTCRDGKNLLVPICTQRRMFDRTCLLGVGDHPFIKAPSFVMYAHLRTYEAKNLIRLVGQEVIQYRDLLCEKVFALVKAGVHQSDHSPLNMQAYLAQQS